MPKAAAWISDCVSRKDALRLVGGEQQTEKDADIIDGNSSYPHTN